MADPMKSEHFVLVFDKDRYKALNGMIGLAMSHEPELRAMLLRYKANGILEPLESLMEEFADKVHENDWCEDPDCKRK